MANHRRPSSRKCVHYCWSAPSGSDLQKNREIERRPVSKKTETPTSSTAITTCSACLSVTTSTFSEQRVALYRDEVSWIVTATERWTAAGWPRGHVAGALHSATASLLLHRWIGESLVSFHFRSMCRVQRKIQSRVTAQQEGSRVENANPLLLGPLKGRFDIQNRWMDEYIRTQPFGLDVPLRGNAVTVRRADRQVVQQWNLIGRFLKRQIVLASRHDDWNPGPISAVELSSITYRPKTKTHFPSSKWNTARWLALSALVLEYGLINALFIIELFMISLDAVALRRTRKSMSSIDVFCSFGVRLATNPYLITSFDSNNISLFSYNSFTSLKLQKVTTHTFDYPTESHSKMFSEITTGFRRSKWDHQS